MTNVWKKTAISGILQLLVIATAIAIAFNIAIMLMPVPFNSYFFGTLQFLWPLLSIMVLLIIYYTSTDYNVRNFAGLIAVALIPWTVTILLWEVLLPLFFNDELAYYVTGFGYLACYAILIYGLFRLRYSRQWFIAPSTNIYINIIAAIAAAATAGFVLFNIQLGSPRLPDVIILLLYLLSDIVILTFCSKLINMNLKPDLKYLVFVVAEFVLINSVADLLFEARWLVSLKQILSYKIADVIDPIYFASLIFMTAALFLYQSRLRGWMLACVDRDVGGRMLYVEDIVDHSPDPMFVSDDRGFLIVANEPLLKLFHTGRGDLTGQFNVFDHLIRQSNETAAIVGHVKACNMATAENARFCPDGGGMRFVSVKIYPLLEPGGRVTNFVGILEDTTDRLHMEEELLDSKRQIELYMDLMGHDINNMNQIGAGFLEMALEKIDRGEPVGVESQAYLEKSLESFRNSSRLIDNIRKLRKVHSSESSLRPIDLGGMMTQAVDMFGNVQGRTVKVLYRPAGEQLVRADDLLKDVFVNLIGNAVKHSSPDRPLTVSIAVEKVFEEGRPQFRVSVEDDGPGVDDARKKELFKRLASGVARTKGIGLYLVRMLVESYGGRVWVEDRVPGDHSLGSRFIVLLPAVTG